MYVYILRFWDILGLNIVLLDVKNKNFSVIIFFLLWIIIKNFFFEIIRNVELYLELSFINIVVINVINLILSISRFYWVGKVSIEWVNELN